MKLSVQRWLLAILGILAGLFILIQLIPYGRDQTNPEVGSEPGWNSARTRELVQAGCYDCHSNQTKWPAYARVAPASWLVYYDVMKAREVFNFNTLTPQQGKGMSGFMVEQIKTNKMPPPQYQALHPEARFSTQEKKDLVDGLLETFK